MPGPAPWLPTYRAVLRSYCSTRPWRDLRGIFFLAVIQRFPTFLIRAKFCMVMCQNVVPPFQDYPTRNLLSLNNTGRYVVKRRVIRD